MVVELVAGEFAAWLFYTLFAGCDKRAALPLVESKPHYRIAIQKVLAPGTINSGFNNCAEMVQTYLKSPLSLINATFDVECSVKVRSGSLNDDCLESMLHSIEEADIAALLAHKEKDAGEDAAWIVPQVGVVVASDNYAYAFKQFGRGILKLILGLNRFDAAVALEADLAKLQKASKDAKIFYNNFDAFRAFLQKHPPIPFNQAVLSLINTASDAKANISKRLEAIKQAYKHADLLPSLYFPTEHLMGVLMPLMVPIVTPLLKALLVRLRNPAKP